jgi:hypothetical protein
VEQLSVFVSRRRLFCLVSSKSESFVGLCSSDRGCEPGRECACDDGAILGIVGKIDAKFRALSYCTESDVEMLIHLDLGINGWR